MAGNGLTIFMLVALVGISAAALAYAFLFQRIEVENKTATRVNRVKSAETDRVKIKAARDRVQELSKRRKSVQDNLKDLEKRQQEKTKKNRDVTLKGKITQAGLTITIGKFYMLSAVLGLVIFLLTLISGLPFLIVLAISFVGGLGLPRWILGFLVGRRQRKFLDEFPNSLDVMCRSIKSGLPLNDAVRLIAADGQEPVKTEFQRILDAQQVGLSIPEAATRMTLTMPLSEVNFFATVITIQAQAGGNLSEALSNLAKVLRERKKMKAKVSALSMEAKASAVIIGALPFIVAFLVYMTSPDYIMHLFTDPRGHIILGVSGVWMSIGILVMRNMINFDI
ncbi:type II secretion system F family protein [Rhizobium sp. CG4]|jgi:tight adherence protein B|uniref:type II secretion system F family protein n=1 Tax=Rhizobium/Agrobacterium group TaxID=227290 RepID=UPI001780FD34|nr:MULTISPECIES: type II secretion system F family protein [Rhizobium/Agrobacterium group]MBD9385749.1 type II secretion system F family protein [Agrobacterium sp. AGB01]MCM2455960.1 type II secretion system F family protein [Rhizobium sp. CG4]MCS4243743.1 tight adherence protein B [Rhizobium sp. BIGb0125]MDO5894255.1 type II secretion system F family protein [Agrobacterium sp. Azo12]